MQTLAPGRPECQRGFSLLEVMVVLLVISITASLVVLSDGLRPQARALRDDAQGLAQWFTLAQAAAHANGRSIIWLADEQAHGFAVLPGPLSLPARLAARLPVNPQSALLGELPRHQSWHASPLVRVQGLPAGGLRFDAEWLAEPMTLELSAAGRRQRLQRLADGRFQVLP